MDGIHGHSSGSGFHGYEQQLRRVQGENEYLRERIKSCERGMVSLWQVSMCVCVCVRVREEGGGGVGEKGERERGEREGGRDTQARQGGQECTLQ